MIPDPSPESPAVPGFSGGAVESLRWNDGVWGRPLDCLLYPRLKMEIVLAEIFEEELEGLAGETF